jgi:hypothetical protein
MATIIVNGNLPASHSQNARRSQRVYADVQVVNEGNADGFAELVLMGDLNGTSGVQEVRRGGGGALLKAYSNYIGGGGPYRVTAIVFEIVNGQRVSPFLARHDNFTANIYVPGPPRGPAPPPPEEEEVPPPPEPPDIPYWPPSEEDEYVPPTPPEPPYWPEPEEAAPPPPPPPPLPAPYYPPSEEEEYVPPYVPPPWETEPDWWRYDE